VSSRPAVLVLAAGATLLLPAAARACDEKPLPACEGSGCTARQLLKDVDVALRRPGGCKVEPVPAQKPGKPALLEMLKGKRESTVLPASRKDEAQGGLVI
jgi:hypothetical protein